MAADDVEISEEALDAGRATALEERERKVDDALRRKKTVDAVTMALEDPPFGSKNAALKDRNTALVLKAVVACGQSDADVATLLDSLSVDLADNLMKYLYKGLTKPDNAGLLLKMHAQLVEKAGMGSVVRAITDRKTA